MSVLFQVPLYGSFCDAFLKVHTVLSEKLDVSHGLLDALQRDSVLTKFHISDIKVTAVLTALVLYL